MKRLIWATIALLGTIRAGGQATYQPVAIGAYENGGSGWAPLTDGAAYGSINWEPPAAALYCQTNAGGPWTPCVFPTGSGTAFLPFTGLVYATSATGGN